ncbi:MAG: hypothetical protein K1X82_02820 [Bacteroidia bacterium]|nr:hypothetical protein [Bacteroidia bacterium]
MKTLTQLNLHRILFVLFISFLNQSCRKETAYIYGVTDVTISRTGANKENVKSTTEFISIAYSDIFGTTIPHSELVKLQAAYSAFGDQKLIEQLVIRNFLNQSGNTIPSATDMNSDLDKFIDQSYIKFFARHPNEYEAYYLKNLLISDPGITPELVYFSMMTSNEYRYY